MLSVTRQLLTKSCVVAPRGIVYSPRRWFYSPEKQSKEELKAEDAVMDARREAMRKQVLERMQFKGKESTARVLFRRSIIGLGIAMTAHFLFHQYAVSRGVFDRPSDNIVTDTVIMRNVSPVALEVMEQNTDMVKDLLHNMDSGAVAAAPEPKIFKGNPYLLMQQQAEESKKAAAAAAATANKQ